MLVAKAAHRAFRRKEGGVRKTHTGRDGCLLRKLARGAGARANSKLLVSIFGCPIISAPIINQFNEFCLIDRA